MLQRASFERPVLECARALIGTELHWHGCSGVVVETEAYAEYGDEACHAFMRPAARRFIEEQAPGTAYVYMNYGIHWMLNVLARGGGENGLILIRAVEPREGIPLMQARRRQTAIKALCSGPGKLGQALGVTGADHGRDLCHTSEVGFAAAPPGVEVVDDIRVGISRAVEFPWRFLLAGSPWVSVAAGKVRIPPHARFTSGIQPPPRSAAKRVQR